MLPAALRRATGASLRRHPVAVAAAAAAAAAAASGATGPPARAESAPESPSPASTSSGVWAWPSWAPPLPKPRPFDLPAGLSSGAVSRQHAPAALSPGPQAERVFDAQPLEDVRLARIRHYEEDIRKLSSTEKIFMYFASATGKDGAVRMTPHDLLRATAGSHLAAAAGADAPLSAHALEFFHAVDADGDGTISWAEFLLLTTLLAIPPRQLEVAFKMFDKDQSGVRAHPPARSLQPAARVKTAV
jgi:hypothetical protein